jgi:hypothetical protein
MNLKNYYCLLYIQKLKTEKIIQSFFNLYTVQNCVPKEYILHFVTTAPKLYIYIPMYHIKFHVSSVAYTVTFPFNILVSGGSYLKTKLKKTLNSGNLILR